MKNYLDNCIFIRIFAYEYSRFIVFKQKYWLKYILNLYFYDKRRTL